MAVNSSTFGAVRLTAADAQKFKRQVTYGRAKSQAVAACAQGKTIAEKYVANGYVVLTKSR